MKHIVATITSDLKTKDFDFIANEEHKNELAIFSKPGSSWNAKNGFVEDTTNDEYVLVKTFSKALDEAQFCSLDMSYEEHENIKKLYYLMMQEK